MIARPACALFVLLAVWDATVLAQTADRPRLEIQAGGGLFGGAHLGSRDATLTANEPVRRAFRLFATESTMARAGAVHVRAAWPLSRRFRVEGGVVRAQPSLRTSISGDAEGAPALTVDERIDQYLFEAGIVLVLDEWEMAGGAEPFVTGGAGYLRQLHEGRTVVEHGHLYHAGAGIRYWLLTRRAALVRGVGLRADVRLYLLASGIAFENDPRSHGAISGSFIVGF